MPLSIEGYQTLVSGHCPHLTPNVAANMHIDINSPVSARPPRLPRPSDDNGFTNYEPSPGLRDSYNRYGPRIHRPLDWVRKYLMRMTFVNCMQFDRRRDYRSAIKATLLIAAVMVTIGYAAPAVADPPTFPSPFMDHDGTYLVGTDIRPGLYLTSGPRGSGNCSWIRQSASGGGDVSNIIDRGESSQAQYALIAPTDKAFETHGCQIWSIGTRPATPIEPPGRTCIYPLTGCQDPNLYAPSP
jgi:hypothetical protein